MANSSESEYPEPGATHQAASAFPTLQEHVPLAPMTTMGVGGVARHFAEAESAEELIALLSWARETGTDVFVLGGGSNVVCADNGFPGLVVRIAIRGIAETHAGDGFVLLSAAAGEPWDGVVEHAVRGGLQGIECLSGIPGC